MYNLESTNLAEHGLHPYYQHFAANLPQLLGPAYLLLFISPRFTLRIASAISGVVILSLFQHQEARFLIPAVPLVLSSVQIPKVGTRAWVAAWIGFNVTLGIFMGSYHQGGVVPTQFFMAGQEDGTQALWWRTYSPPIWLLDGMNSQLKTTDLMGMRPDLMIKNLRQALTCGNSTDSISGPDGIYLIAPLSSTFLDPYTSPGGKEDLHLEQIWLHKSHLNLDDMDFPGDGVWATLKPYSCTSLLTLALGSSFESPISKSLGIAIDRLFDRLQETASSDRPTCLHASYSTIIQYTKAIISHGACCRTLSIPSSSHQKPQHKENDNRNNRTPIDFPVLSNASASRARRRQVAPRITHSSANSLRPEGPTSRPFLPRSADSKELDNKRIVKYLDAFTCKVEDGEEEDTDAPPHPILYMECCNLGDLFGIIDTYILYAPTPIPNAFIWYIFIQTADALAYLHHEPCWTSPTTYETADDWLPIQHRDIKPGNVLLHHSTSSQRVYPQIKLYDLGCAVRADDSAYRKWNASDIGTPCRQPPERPQLSAEVDVWGLGAVVHALYWGVEPPLRKRLEE
ncbi:MAG: alpha 1,2 mannosyltransferase [Pycnora praestabilis]|nr:MAG: alpha 1,2 mannosyltransferase [Pycnora praestabilis]